MGGVAGWIGFGCAVCVLTRTLSTPFCATGTQSSSDTPSLRRTSKLVAVNVSAPSTDDVYPGAPFRISVVTLLPEVVSGIVLGAVREGTYWTCLDMGQTVWPGDIDQISL